MLFQRGQVQTAGQGAAADQVIALQHIVGLVAAVALRVIVRGRDKLEGVRAALDQTLKPQIFARCRAGFVRCDLLCRQNGTSIVEIDCDRSIVQNGAVWVIDPQIQELCHICRQKQITVLDNRKGLLGGELIIGHADRDQVFLTALAHHRLNRKCIFREMVQSAPRHGDLQLHRG